MCTVCTRNLRLRFDETGLHKVTLYLLYLGEDDAVSSKGWFLVQIRVDKADFVLHDRSATNEIILINSDKFDFSTFFEEE